MTDEPPAVEAVKQAPAKKAPAKKAAKKVPAKKAPAKKAPAKKAAAKKSPAKKAAATKASGTPRSSILNRIAELEERIAADGPLPTGPAPRTRRPLPVVPPPPPEPEPEPAPAPAEPVAETEPEAAPVATPEAVEPAAAPTPKPKATPKPKPVRRETKPVPVVDAAESAPAPVVPEPTRVAPVPRTEPSAVRGNRVLAGLIVLLLSVAAALGAAAAVKDRPATWRSEQSVALHCTAPCDSSGEQAVVDRVAAKVPGSGFAGLAAASAGVPASQLRAYVSVTRKGTEQLVLVVRAKTAAAAQKLADSAGRQLLLTLAVDQATVSDGNKRVLGAVTGSATQPVREKPTDKQTWVTGLLAGLAVLLVGAVLLALMTGDRTRSRA